MLRARTSAICRPDGNSLQQIPKGNVLYLMGSTGFPKGNERLPVERKLHMEIHDIQVLTDSDNKGYKRTPRNAMAGL